METAVENELPYSLSARWAPGLSEKVKRRADLVGIFPNEDSIVRLIGAVLLEANDEWQGTAPGLPEAPTSEKVESI